jgi:hypothetical protein
MNDKEMPLSAAARALSMPHRRAWDLVLSGKLDARQAENGRWLVASASVASLKAQRDAARTSVAA